MLRVIVLFLIQINKTMKQINKVVLGAMLFPLAVFAQQMDYSKAIPFDSTVKGKTKWQPILHQEKCQTRKKVDLRLVVNAGSILETDDQQGLAHFMEHMCFNGTKRFPKTNWSTIYKVLV
jgi:zinc protease